MKKLILFILPIIIFLCGCSQSKNQETFEGTITYNISVTTNTDNLTYNDYQKQKYGNKLKICISKDVSFKREFLTSGLKGFMFFSYDALTNIGFTKWKNIDTIYSSICSDNSLTLLEEKELAEENLLGQSCKGYFISGLDRKGGQLVSLTYFYPLNKEYINPKLYKNYKDFFYNKIIEKTQAPFYKLIMNMGNYIVTYEIEKIENGIVSSEILNLPANIPIKDI
jgi:hypothetical protein